MAQGTTARVTTVGIDIAKNGVCIHGVDAHGHVVVKKRLARQKVLPFLTQLPPLPYWYGSLGRRALLGAGVYTTRPHSETHVPTVCETVCAEPEK